MIAGGTFLYMRRRYITLLQRFYFNLHSNVDRIFAFMAKCVDLIDMDNKKLSN